VNTDLEKSNGDKAESITERANANGNRENAPAGFNWITERFACSLPKVFSTLRSQLELDVHTRNSLRPNHSPYEFSIGEDSNAVTVRFQAEQLQKSVVFALADHAITVRDDQGNRMFEVTASFDDAGKCRLRVNGEEREFWQVRRMALEDLMFRGLRNREQDPT
jgi:hypothetical protein